MQPAYPRYNPETDGRPQHKNCPRCESLDVISMYTRIARKKAETGEGLPHDVRLNGMKKSRHPPGTFQIILCWYFQLAREHSFLSFSQIIQQVIVSACVLWMASCSTTLA
jgi:hypothetical protein